jgi:hypothetical protein
VAAGGASLSLLLLYLVTLAPTTALWDAGEYMATAYTLGLPHPPGNPLFVLLGRVFALLPIAPTVAQRINVLAAVASAVAAGVWFLIAHRVLERWGLARWQRIAGAAAAALIGGTAFTVWHESVAHEKVYTLTLAGLAIISWLMVGWLDEPDGARADRRLLLVAYLLGLGYSVHMAGMLAGPAVAIAVITRRPRTIFRWRLLGGVALLVALGLTPFATQPIRAALHPPINSGEPTGCVDGLAIECTFSKETVTRLKDHLDRTQFQKPPVTERQAAFADQVAMWWMYFRWQWMRDADGDSGRTQQGLAVLFLALGLAGAWMHWRHDRRSFTYVAPLIVMLTIGLIFYLNFKLGYTQAVERGAPIGGDSSEVRDRDYFYLWGFSAWGMWVALGLVWAWRSLAGSGDPSPGRGGTALRARSRLPLALAAPVLALAAIPLATNWSSASRAGDTFAREWAIDLLNSVEPYGILVTNGDNDTFPLWYAQEVEGVRRDVTVAVAELLGTDWYVRSIIRRPTEEYDPARGPAIYRGRSWPRPVGPALRMTIEEADSIGPYYYLQGPQQFVKDSMAVTIRGQTHPNLPHPYVQRDHIVVLRFIRDSFPDRGIFFSGGGYAHDLGFGPYLVRQGLVDKLVPRPAAQVPGIVPVQGAGWVDAERTMALWRDVYTAPESLLTHGKWIDAASNTLPRAYAGTAVLASELFSRRGETAAADSALTTARRIWGIVGID